VTAAAPRIRLWRQTDEMWRWCYVEPGPDGAAGRTLVSNRAYDTRDEAHTSATAAYPGIDIEETPRPETPARPRWFVLAVIVFLHLIRHLWRTGQNRRRPQ
jgi:hypothetical protein